MNRQHSQGRDGYVMVEVFAETEMRDLPEWIDSRKIVEAALHEYRRQRDDAVGPLPLPETREAFGDGEHRG